MLFESIRPHMRLLYRRLSRFSDLSAECLIRLCGYSSILFSLAILFFLLGGTIPLFTDENFSFLEFFTSPRWSPNSAVHESYGAVTLMIGTLSVVSLATLIAIPVGLSVSVFISEYCTGKVREVLKFLVELLATIPSILWGVVGYTLLAPWFVRAGATVGVNLLTGAILVAWMALPIIASLGEDALRAVPATIREVAIALGANRREMIWRVLCPAARKGLLSAVFLGLGRVVSDTMVVLVTTGNSNRIPTSLMTPVRTLSATIASELGETSIDGTHQHVLFLIGILLLGVTFIVNLIASWIVHGIRTD